jgi:UDP-glucose 4-epimerase
MFENKTLLITGGTGSFGNAFLNRFLPTKFKEIRIFSRDEKKQEDLRNLIQDRRVKYFIGDVRDVNSLEFAIEGVDFIFHAAALKQVPSCEFYPNEALRTNSLGTENVLNVAIRHSVSKVICLSTDKAVYPINAMGISKAMMEKIAIAKSRVTKKTQIMITRYGNVMASRGSVIPLFVSQIKNKQPITITDPKMTRFMMSLDGAVELVLFAFKKGKSGDIFVHKAPAATIGSLAEVLKEVFNSKSPKKIIGTRHAEKQYETLLTREEFAKAKDMDNFYRISPDDRDLNYQKYFTEGEESFSQSEDYNSNNTRLLDHAELKALLLKLPFIKNELLQWPRKS